MSKVIVQYIVVRRDLNWPLGALMAQACHASTAATHLHYQHPGNSSKKIKDHKLFHRIFGQIKAGFS